MWRLITVNVSSIMLNSSEGRSRRERRYGKASAVGMVTFAFAEEVWVMIHLQDKKICNSEGWGFG